MLFSDDQRLPLLFQKATFKQDRDGNKFSKMHFALKLTPEIARRAPKIIQAAYEAVETRENEIASASIGKDLEGVQIEFYSLPEKGRPTQALPLNMTELSVQRTMLSEPWLYFSAAAKLNDREQLRHWVVDNVFCQLWATFQMAQMELGEIAEPQKKSETTVSMGVKNPETGKMEYTDPIPVEEFDQRLKQVGRNLKSVKVKRKP